MEANPLQAALDARMAALGPDSVINLIDSNFLDNGFVLPPGILRDGFERYLGQRCYHPESRGARPAREAIADWYLREQTGMPPAQAADPIKTSWAVADRIILTASSSESYNLLFQTFTAPGDNILLPSPGYPLFEDLCHYNHLEPRFYPLNEASGWQPDLDVLDSLADERTRFMVLISPNNPCGSILGESELSIILDFCRRNELMVISDEVFSAFRYLPGPLPRAAQTNARLPMERQVPLFTINGISKLFACPDLKLSWIVCSGPAHSEALPDTAELVRELELRNDTFLNCNSFSQFILPELFHQAASFTDSMISRLAGNRKSLSDRLVHHLPEGSRLVLPAGGIHCLLTFSRYAVSDDEALAIRLVETGVYTHPGYLYGMHDHPALVLSLLKEEMAFHRGLDRLAAALPALL